MLSQVSILSCILVLRISLVDGLHLPDDSVQNSADDGWDDVVPEDQPIKEDTIQLQEKENTAGAKKPVDPKKKATADKAQALREKQAQMKSALKDMREKAKKAGYELPPDHQLVDTQDSRFAGLESGFHDPSHKVTDSNDAVTANSIFNVDKADKDAVAASKAATQLSDATGKFQKANKVYQQTQDKLVELRALLEKKKANLQAQMSKKASSVTDADRDELDKLNDMVENLMDKAELNRESMEKSKKLVAEQMVRAGAFFTAADKSLSALRKQSMKAVRERDRDWLNEETARLLKAQDKLHKLRDAAGIHQAGLSEHLDKTGELPELTPAVIDEIEKGLASGTADLESMLAEAANTEDQLMRAEDRQQELREKFAQNRRDEKAGKTWTEKDTRSTKELAAEQAQAELDQKKKELEEKKNFLTQKKKAQKKEKVPKTPEEIEKLRAEEAARATVRKVAQKKRVQANIERAITIEIEAQKKRVELDKKIKATTHRLKVELGHIKDPNPKSSPIRGFKELPPSLHFDEDPEEPEPTKVVIDALSEEDEEAVNKRVEEITHDPLLDTSPAGRKLLEGGPDRRTMPPMIKEF